VQTKEADQAEKSSSDRVVDYVTQGVLNGRIVPGQRLVEADLTEAVGVSRGPVREGLRRLEVTGIVSQSRHRGAFVRKLGRREASDLVIAIEPLSVLIASLAARAVSSAGARENADVARHLSAYIEQREDAGALLSQRRHFYDLLVKFGGNSQIPSILPIMRIQLMRLQVQSFDDAENRRRHLEDYSRIASAVADGNVKEAERAMMQHMRNMKNALDKLPDEAFANSAELD
jgi:DNA-binding GntR family transcriptional regulator